ncbi:site-specific DNA-methyltransferase [Frankia sp. AgPm24]|uniref:TRM11 family SAM-dependent methyltransferase n=1 Tax=Frankia sp. AgPm24 TaxID=631128 RepID=UPI0020106990|nr:DNA methyltransferase [Frankia sp. AgPm24]MCK9921919.1 site-specific DNA-methyltransferase [Frankia sp. AgPm24]
MTPHARPAPSYSILPAGQQHPRLQRAGRYTPASMQHPARMLPALARQLITTYSQPGDLILDPMCGIGTSLVEATHLGRGSLGVDLEARWVSLARANLHLARVQGAPRTGQVFRGDARRLGAVIPARYHGRISLLLTSPPYGQATHGIITAAPGRGVHKTDYRYSASPENLANTDLDGLLDGMSALFTAAHTLLRPGGLLALAVRPYRHAGILVDLPGALIDLAADTGLHLHARAAALLAALHPDGALTPRATFFALHNIRTARAAGHPLHLIAHEDILLLRTPQHPPDRTPNLPQHPS